MASNASLQGGSGVRVGRSHSTTNGVVPQVDRIVGSHLNELNFLFSKRIFSPRAPKAPKPTDPPSSGGASKGLSPAVVLKAELTPKRVLDPAMWEAGSLAESFSKAPELKEAITLSEYIDKTAELSILNYAFDDLLRAEWSTLAYNAKTILNPAYAGIRDYLVTFAFLVMDLQEVKGLKNFVLNNRMGVANITSYAVVSAARTIIRSKALLVPKYDDDLSPIVADIQAAKLSLSTTSFADALLKIVDDHIFSLDEAALIDAAKIGPIPESMKPQLILYIKRSPIPITIDNINYFLPLFISQIKGAGTVESEPVSPEESDKDFEVEFFEGDQSLVQVSRSAVMCAAQLYYAMVLGDELEVFNVANYFTHKYLLRGGIEIADSRLRDDLQAYVFSNRFTNLKTKQVVDRTRPAERHMFYRQVFDTGGANVTEDVIVNRQFTRLWNILMMESAQYLERAQASPHPDNFVSRQKVMQAVEDVQYDLSTHCTGMANVITPLIYAELNFVIKRIFMHPEVLKQVVPVGGTWWRVVEKLYMGMRNERPKTTVLYNKAKLGHEIIESIADYNPATFEDDTSFSDFISNVDAFITTQSILQEALMDDLRQDPDEDGTSQNGHRVPAPDLAAAPTAPGSQPSADEWDF